MGERRRVGEQSSTRRLSRLDGRHNMQEVPITFNSREIIIPLFRVGVPEYKYDTLVKVWEQFKDWKMGK